MTKRHVVLRTLKPKSRRLEQKLFRKKMSSRQGPLKAPKQIHLDTQCLQRTFDFSFC